MTINTDSDTMESSIPDEIEAVLGKMLDTETGSGNFLRKNAIYNYLDYAYTNGTPVETAAINIWMTVYFNEHSSVSFQTEDKRKFFTKLKAFIKELNPKLHKSEETTTTLSIAKANEAGKVLNK